MAQINSDIVFNNFPGLNSQVTAELLNNHVNGAKLLPGAISEQVATTPVASDSILIQRATQLYKSTVQQFIDSLSATLLPKSGGTMTGALILSGAPTAANQAATKAYVDSIAPAPAAPVPAGTIAMWGTPTPPTGWVEMRGQSTAPYPALAPLFGSVIPDMRGEFVRGWANDRDVDEDRQIRSDQPEEVGPHVHTYSQPYTTTAIGFGNPNGIVAIRSANTSNPTPTVTHQETRPRNVALMFIVKTS